MLHVFLRVLETFAASRHPALFKSKIDAGVAKLWFLILLLKSTSQPSFGLGPHSIPDHVDDEQHEHHITEQVRSEGFRPLNIQHINTSEAE